MRVPENLRSERSNDVIAKVADSFEQLPPVAEMHAHVTWMDGLLTAAAIGPFRTNPHDWMRAYYGSVIPNDSPEYVEPLMTLWSIRYNGILNAIGREKRNYKRDFLLSESDEDHVAGAKSWIDGFLTGTRLHEGRWSSLFRDESRNYCVGLLAAFLLKPADLSTADKPQGDEKALEELQKQSIEFFGTAIYEAYCYWRERNGEARRQPQRLGKVGRNDPCHCGSGGSTSAAAPNDADPVGMPKPNPWV